MLPTHAERPIVGCKLAPVDFSDGEIAEAWAGRTTKAPVASTQLSRPCNSPLRLPSPQLYPSELSESPPIFVTYSRTMISSVRGWLRRNRTPVAIGVGIVGAGYVVSQYVMSKISDARERMTSERISKEK